MITLKNQSLTIRIAEMGAELKSIRKADIEYLWEGRPEVWSGSAPLMFPICGGLRNDTYCYAGKEYSLPKHGYARNTLFSVERATDTEAVFLHISNEETRKVFPFDYELRVLYTLTDATLKIGYEVRNLTDGEMYFSIGSHEAYYTPEGIEDYDVIFPREETLSAYVLYGNLLSQQKLPILKEGRVLPLYDKYFTIDALVFKDLVSRSATLRNRKTGRALRVDFPNADFFLLWHKPNAPYICLEPWAGVQDSTEADGELTHKEGILHLEKGDIYQSEHCITLL